MENISAICGNPEIKVVEMVNWILLGIAAILLLIHANSPGTIPGIIDSAQRAITSPQAAINVSQDTLSNDITIPAWLILVLLVAVVL